jgi:hypothetical protein
MVSCRFSLKPIQSRKPQHIFRQVDTFGSLSAAFKELDQHDREEITRSQWDAALNARGWNTEDGMARLVNGGCDSFFWGRW